MLHVLYELLDNSWTLPRNCGTGRNTPLWTVIIPGKGNSRHLMQTDSKFNVRSFEDVVLFLNNCR